MVSGPAKLSTATIAVTGTFRLPCRCCLTTFVRMAITRYNLSKLKGKIIAIDGPAGSGKSTTARLLAAALGYQYLDTGAMYRALTWLALRHDVSPSDEAKLTILARSVAIEFETHEDINLRK